MVSKTNLVENQEFRKDFRNGGGVPTTTTRGQEPFKNSLTKERDNGTGGSDVMQLCTNITGPSEIRQETSNEPTTYKPDLGKNQLTTHKAEETCIEEASMEETAKADQQGQLNGDLGQATIRYRGMGAEELKIDVGGADSMGKDKVDPISEKVLNPVIRVKQEGQRNEKNEGILGGSGENVVGFGKREALKDITRRDERAHPKWKLLEKLILMQTNENDNNKDGCAAGGGGNGGRGGAAVAIRIISWNCRGLGNQFAVRSLCQLVKNEGPKVLFLMETKLDSVGMVRQMFKSDSIGPSHLPHGQSGFLIAQSTIYQHPHLIISQLLLRWGSQREVWGGEVGVIISLRRSGLRSQNVRKSFEVLGNKIVLMAAQCTA
uniref:Endonuclease/exonuclease/phosphatase domain-containing protein n=1 Tax=Fagus sylvatica TaxID=28930 RepID=A0A2N9HUR9_FAGSY